MSEAEVSPSEHSAAGHASIWPFVGAMGLGVGMLGLGFPVDVDIGGLVFNLRPILILAGLAIIFTGVGGWLYQDARGHRIGVVEGPIEDTVLSGISNRKVGMWLFLASEIFFFSGIIGASLSLRARAGWIFPNWPAPGEVLNVPLTAVNTFILVASSLTMVESLRGMELGKLARARGFLLATLILGIIFLSIQVSEYRILFFEHNLTPWPNAVRPDLAVFGTTFYMQTGFHGAHVTGGVIALGFLNIKAWRGKYNQQHHEAVELVGLYWHFVDVVWIFLFTIVYLI